MAVLKEFNPVWLKTVIMLTVKLKNFPGITQNYLLDLRDWLNDDENWKWLLKQRDAWEHGKEYEEPDDPLVDLEEEDTAIEEPVEEPVEEPLEFSNKYHHVFVDGDGETPFYDGTRVFMQCHGEAPYDSVQVGSVKMNLRPGTDNGRHFWISREPGLFDNGNVLEAYRGGEVVLRVKLTGRDTFGRC